MRRESNRVDLDDGCGARMERRTPGCRNTDPRAARPGHLFGDGALWSNLARYAGLTWVVQGRTVARRGTPMRGRDEGTGGRIRRSGLGSRVLTVTAALAALKSCSGTRWRQNEFQ